MSVRFFLNLPWTGVAPAICKKRKARNFRSRLIREKPARDQKNRITSIVVIGTLLCTSQFDICETDIGHSFPFFGREDQF